jgi:hypothetical protein
MAFAKTKHLKGISASPEGKLSSILKRASFWACSDAISYADTGSEKTLFTFPANITILAVVPEVETALSGTITAGPVLVVGDGSTTGLYGTWRGVLTDAGSYPHWLFAEKTSAGSIKATLTATGSSAGSVKVWVNYQPNSNEDRIFTR